MKVAFIYPYYAQVSEDEWKKFHKTKVFDIETHTLKDVMTWAKSVNSQAKFSDLITSDIDE